MRTIWSVLDRNFDNDFWYLWDRGLERKINKNKINIKEDNKGINVIYDVPGYTKKDIDISVINDILKIKGEIEGREFENSWSIDNSMIDIKNIKATVKNGVLDMYIPYRKQIDNTYKIQIE